jgi:hypothetical protein
MTPAETDAWGREAFFNDNEFISSRCAEGGGVFLRRKDNMLWILVEKEASASALVSCFKEALEAGWMKLSMPTLVDLTRFTGAVDWGAIRAISKMARWGTDKSEVSRVAYLVRDGQFNALVKIVSALFPLSSHRPFSNPEHALTWLSVSKLRQRARR